MSAGLAYLADDDTQDEDAAFKQPNPRDLFQLATGEPERPKRPAPATIAVVYPLYRLGSKQLQKTLVVSVEWDDSEVVMSNSKLRIWGVGHSIYEALDDFTRTFQDVLTSYKETPFEELTPGAVSYLHEMSSFFGDEP